MVLISSMYLLRSGSQHRVKSSIRQKDIRPNRKHSVKNTWVAIMNAAKKRNIPCSMLHERAPTTKTVPMTARSRALGTCSDLSSTSDDRHESSTIVDDQRDLLELGARKHVTDNSSTDTHEAIGIHGFRSSPQ